MRGVFEYFGVNSPLAARARQAKCAPALVKSGIEVREYSDGVQARNGGQFLLASAQWMSLSAFLPGAMVFSLASVGLYWPRELPMNSSRDLSFQGDPAEIA